MSSKKVIYMTDGVLFLIGLQFRTEVLSVVQDHG